MTTGRTGRVDWAWWRRRESWWGWFAIACAAVLAPWIAYLRLTLPRTYLVTGWNPTWVGFDVLLLLAFLATGLAALRRSAMFVVLAAMTAAMLFVDAWFDVMMAQEPEDLADSALAVALEAPLGIALLLAAVFRLRAIQSDRGAGGGDTSGVA